VIENGRLATAGLPRSFARSRTSKAASDAVVQRSRWALRWAKCRRLEKRFGRKAQHDIKEDPSLIGGIRVVVGDESRHFGKAAWNR
jgi:F-type H+-transporting ATPase subunit delta